MTKELTPEELTHNWGNLRQIIDATFTEERLEKLNEMYDYFEERMMFAPASGNFTDGSISMFKRPNA